MQTASSNPPFRFHSFFSSSSPSAAWTWAAFSGIGVLELLCEVALDLILGIYGLMVCMAVALLYGLPSLAILPLYRTFSWTLT